MNIAILGYGKMGKTIESFAKLNKHSILLRISSDNANEFSKNALKDIDVAIEFSRPESAFQNIKTCLTNGVPVVSGTTGWLNNIDAAKKLAEQHKCGFVYASNFSVGVNIFFEINKKLAQFMNNHPSYAVDVHEIHHTQKLDAPSGTGITLGEDIIDNIDRLETWVPDITAQKKELGITSERLGKTPGTHLINYTSEIDSIQIKHVANNRDGFAKGALLAAEWIVGKQGFFEMKDVLGI